jgi:DNA-binding NarL/FixJ family response regulator
MKEGSVTSNRRQRHPPNRITRSTSRGAIRVLIVEAQRLFRQGLRLLLEQERDVSAVTEATDGREAYRLVIEHQPTIVLLDIDMPILDVGSITRLIHQHRPDTRVLLLARYDEDIRIVTALRAGAFGYILKDTDQTDFLRIIRATAQGERILSPLISAGFVHNLPGTVRPPHENHTTLLLSLTEREREILVCAAAGRSNKEIAEQLCVSIDTVKTHLHHIYQKLSVDGRVEAILTYLQTQ